MSNEARRRAAWTSATGLVVVALGIAYWAYRAHGGIGTRVLVYRFAWGLFVEHPMLGIGGGNWSLAVASAPLGVSRFWFRTHAHSLPLQIVVEVGLLGLACAMVTFFTPLWVAWRRLSSAPEEWHGVANGAIAGVLGLLAHNLVHYFLRDAVDGILTGLLLGLAIAASSHRDAEAAPVRRSSGPG
jgi:O-antigen ligase